MGADSFQIVVPATHLDAAAADIGVLYRSCNRATVVLPGVPSSNASAVVVGQKSEGGFVVRIGLHLEEVGRTLVFAAPGPPVDAAGAREAAKDAIAFAESMGFLMENLNWKQLSPEAQQSLLDEIEAFKKPAQKGPDAGARPADPRTGLARLLVQF